VPGDRDPDPEAGRDGGGDGQQLQGAPAAKPPSSQSARASVGTPKDAIAGPQAAGAVASQSRPTTR
jgi:hypothetical protein